MPTVKCRVYHVRGFLQYVSDQAFNGVRARVVSRAVSSVACTQAGFHLIVPACSGDRSVFDATLLIITLSHYSTQVRLGARRFKSLLQVLKKEQDALESELLSHRQKKTDEKSSND